MTMPGKILNLGFALATALSLWGCNRAKDARASQTSPVSSTASLRTASPAAGLAAGTTSSMPAVAVPTSASSSAVSSADSSATPAGQQNAPKVTATDKSQTLTVWQHNFRLITHLLSIEGTSEQTVEWWELRDANDRVVHRATYPVAFQNGGFESTVDINASAFNTSQGGGILIHGFDLPSAPNSGGWVQVFGYKYGREKYGADPSLFGSFGVVSEEFLDVNSDESRPSPTMRGGATMTVMHDVMRFRLWTGNFNIVYPVLVNWITGKLEPAARCLEMTSKGRVERCTYPITVEDPVRATEPTFVRLFLEPDDGGATPKHVIVQPQSKIEYVEARVPIGWTEDSGSISFGVNGDVWLKVRIDGQEGWIHSEEDFQAVGLPQAG